MRTPLTAGQLDDALAGLPAWSGDIHRIARTVGPAAVTAGLLAAVAAEAAALDHHPVVEHLGDGGVRLVLWTHVRDAVTELDVALAVRLDALLDR